MFNTILVYPLLNVLMFLYAVIPGHDFGVAVIILTVLIRLILWPIVGKQLHSQKKLQEIQPEIAKIRAKTKGDRQKESAALMELYKEKEINPFSSCLPLIIQLPFLFALFVVFRQATGDFNLLLPHLYDWVKNLAFIKDIIAGQSVFKPEFLGIIDMAQPNVILAVLAGVTQFFQARMITPKPPKDAPKDPQAQMTAIMTMIFPILTVFIGIRLPSALALYWVVTTVVAILQQWLVMRSETEKMEEMKITKRVKK